MGDSTGEGVELDSYVRCMSAKHICTSFSGPSSWPRAPETPADSYVIRALEASFVLMRQLWVGSWMGAGPEKDGTMLRSLAFSVPPPFSREGLGAGNGVNNRPCLHGEPP